MSLKFILLILIKFCLCENATENHCSKTNFYCSDKCVSFRDVCDGINDCGSWEEENENICIKNTCPEYSFRCSYGACIDGDKKCDGVKDCTDNSDEDEDETCFKPRVSIQSEFDENCGEFDWPDTKKPYPWHAGVWIETDNGPRRICAGTIITKYHVITAVDCFWDSNMNVLDNSNTYTVTAGIRGEIFSQYSKIISVDYHMSFDSNNIWQRKIDNIAIITVENPFVFDELVQPVCVSNEMTKLETKKYTMVSWNITRGDDENSEPKQIDMEERNEECWSMIGKDSVTDTLYETKFLCMAADVCGHSQDIGAGLFDFINGRYYLRGVLSHTDQKDFEYCNYQIFTNINDDIPLIINRIYKNDICPSHRFYCDNKCIDGKLICDKNKDCTDGSDEDYVLCVQPSFPMEFPEDNFTCGVTKDDDGKTPFPWHAAVFEETESGPRLICAGTIVTSLHVLSDVECFWNPSTNNLKESRYTIAADFSRKDNFGSFRPVAKIHYDKQYTYYEDWQQMYTKIAVVELVSPFEFGEYIQPVCLDGRFQYEQTYFNQFSSQMVGWNIKENSNSSGEIKQISVKAPTTECWDSITPNHFYRPGSSLLCSTSEYCGELNDVGAGMFTKVNEKYYYRGMLTSPPKIKANNPYMPCYNRMHVSIIPNIPFVEKQIFSYYEGDYSIDDNRTYCNEYEFQCEDGKCISELQVCNGISECDDNSDETPELCDDEVSVLYEDCGKFDTVNDTKPFPWHVAVWKEIKPNPKRICSGTIISPDYIISAADCFWDNINDSLSDDKFTITAGYNETYFQQYRYVSKIYTNNYTMRNGNKVHINNIALLKLESPLEFNEIVNAVCVSPRFSNKLYVEKSSNAKFMGWLPKGFTIGFLILFRSSFCRKNIPDYYLPKDDTKQCTGLSPCIYLIRYLDRAVPFVKCTEEESHLIGQCGLPSNHGGGLFVEHNGIYYLKGVLDPAFNGHYTDICRYNIYTKIGTFTDYLHSIIN